jgi:hypothetical protein
MHFEYRRFGAFRESDNSEKQDFCYTFQRTISEKYQVPRIDAFENDVSDRMKIKQWPMKFKPIFIE